MWRGVSAAVLFVKSTHPQDTHQERMVQQQRHGNAPVENGPPSELCIRCFRRIRAFDDVW